MKKVKLLIAMLIMAAIAFAPAAQAAKAPKPHAHKKVTKRGESPVVFWTSDCSYGDIEVFVNNVLQGEITKCYSSAPQCASPGCVTVIVSGTTNVWRAQTKDGKRKWESKQVNLRALDCNSERLL